MICLAPGSKKEGARVDIIKNYHLKFLLVISVMIFFLEERTFLRE